LGISESVGDKMDGEGGALNHFVGKPREGEGAVGWHIYGSIILVGQWEDRVQQ